MVAEMLVEIKNLGVINEANLEIGKINIIVGKNSTGKSTSSKLLFSLLTSASSEGTQIANRGIRSRFLRFLMYWESTGPQDMKERLRQIRRYLSHSHNYDDFKEVKSFDTYRSVKHFITIDIIS